MVVKYVTGRGGEGWGRRGRLGGGGRRCDKGCLASHRTCVPFHLASGASLGGYYVTEITLVDIHPPPPRCHLKTYFLGKEMAKCDMTEDIDLGYRRQTVCLESEGRDNAEEIMHSHNTPKWDQSII
jgi:hypothetical protein